jgi:hypothetical protein
MGTSFVSSSECCCATIHSLFFFTKLIVLLDKRNKLWLRWITLLVYVPKIVLLVFNEDIFRVGAGSLIILMIMKEQTLNSRRKL